MNNKLLSVSVLFIVGSIIGPTSQVIAQADNSLFEREGISLEAVYTSDLYRNTSGGIETGSRYLQNLDLAASFDLPALFDGGIGEVFVYLLYNDTTGLSDIVGDLQGASNIDADQGWRLYELWWDVAVSETIGLRVGLYDLNSEFDAIETAGYFINSSHGIGPDYSQSGQNAPSIFPTTSTAIRLQWAPDDSMILRYALLDGVPGDPTDSDAFVSTGIRDGEGLLHALELENTFEGGTRAAVGVWNYSAEFEKINEFAGGQPLTDTGNKGVYAFVDSPVYRSNNGTWINAFGRYGIANQNYNQFSNYLGFGAVMGGFWDARPEDTFGLAIANATNGDDFRNLNSGLVDSNETAIELTYSTQINDYLRIQPDIQYVINPGTDPALDNALVVGVRFEIGFATP